MVLLLPELRVGLEELTRLGFVSQVCILVLVVLTGELEESLALGRSDSIVLFKGRVFRDSAGVSDEGWSGVVQVCELGS